jgi:hypothetical protein
MVKLVRLQKKPDPQRGMLCIAETDRDIPFTVQRIFYMYDMPVDGERGDHAHRAQHQFLIAMHGKLSVIAHSAKGTESFTLDEPALGLHVPPMTWLTIRALTSGAVCLVLSSDHYDEADYIRDRTEFDRLIGG